MGLGVLEVRGQGPVPGTVNVLEEEGQTKDARLKKHGDIILVPQPSDDPNDPLNWPLWKRDLILFVLCLISLIASTLSPLLAANTITLALWFEKPFTEVALLTGYHLLGVGVSGFVFVASARVWGKRHLYLIGTLLIIISSAWGGGSGRNYTSILWARIFQGFGLAPFEALVNASVGDLYFVHERGLRMAASNMSLFGGAFFTPIIVGKITATLGWQWTFYLIAIFAGALFPFVFFFVPETAYRRPDYLNTDVQREDNIGSQDLNNIEPAQSAQDEKSVETEPIPPKQSFAHSLLPFNGRKTDENFFKLLLRPFPLFLHPAILWGCLIQGALIGWTVMIGVVLAAIFLGPPLWFDQVTTGYMYTGPFLGALLGFMLAGLIADWSAKLMIKKNNGVFEPEFRIILVIPQMIFGCLGLYMFGWAAANVQPGGYFLPDFFFALEVMGMVIGAVASGLYIVDAHREISIEAFTCMLVFKNIFSFGLTWSAYNWLISSGIWPIFIAMGSVQVGICLLSIPMYIFGKWNRAFMRKYDILKILHLW